MRWPGICWIGLASATALWLALIRSETGRFEQKLADRAGAVAHQLLGAEVDTVAEGRDVRLKGLLFDESALQSALAAIAAVPGVRKVEDALTAPPSMTPYVWRARRDGGIVTLSGGVPSPEARGVLVAEARLAAPEGRIVDSMVYASDAPAAFLAKARGTLGVLGHLSHGEAQRLDGRWTVSGQAETAAEDRAARAAAEAAPGPIELAIEAPLPSALSFAAEIDEKGLRMSGAVGSEADRVALLALARKSFPGAPIADNLERAATSPRFAAESAFALRALAQLKSGKVILSSHRARLEGVAKPGMDASSVGAALAPNSGLALDVGNVAAGDASPYWFSAEKSSTTLDLGGFCGDSTSCAAVRAAAQEKFAGLPLRDATRAAPGAPKGFLLAATGGLEQLARLGAGRFSLRDATVALKGDAGRAEQAESIRTALMSAMPPGFGVTADVTGADRADVEAAEPPSPLEAQRPPETPTLTPSPAKVAPPPLDEACKSRLGALARASAIQFDFASADIPPDGAGRLAALAAEAAACPQISLEVYGHSDDSGTIEHNFDWSWRRAEAVAAFLLAAGLAPSRLKIEGFGETMPVAPNDSDAHRAQNRRIEIQVK